MRVQENQRKKLEMYEDTTRRIHDLVWGLLPPSRERDAIRFHLLHAAHIMNDLRKEPEQMTMEELENDRL